MTKFFGKIFLINFAVGVVTGIVREFQFGMNWSAYSRFVGDVFGAPLAMAAWRNTHPCLLAAGGYCARMWLAAQAHGTREPSAHLQRNGDTHDRHPPRGLG